MTTATPVPTGHTRRTVAIVAAAAVTALAMVFFMISSVTGAAWTDTTRNDGNSWATGSVSLTDDDLGVAMFTVTGMVPGQTVTNDITVTNESTVALNVRLYAENLTATTVDLLTLADWLNVSVGTTLGGSDVYSGTLADFGTDFASGTPTIGMASLGTQNYFFSVTLDSLTPTGFQAAAASVDFVWEGQTQ